MISTEAQPTLDQGKAIVQDLASQASEVGRQAVGQAGELVQNVAPQAREAASNLYEQGSQSPIKYVNMRRSNMLRRY